MTKEEAINKINDTPSIYLNDDQKRISIGIIESITKGQDILNYFDFIMKRADVGFKFDVAPEIAIGRIAVVNEMKELNININDDIDINENKLIIGDNYEALKNLLLTHKEKIDIIYIDPPYNTEKSKQDGNSSSKEGQSSKFIYKDKFGRNGWLNMMRDRLILARRLLSHEGVIFVSIDDNEQAYLKVLMDNIFGENNFISSLPRRTKISGSLEVGFFKNEHEYTLVYRKDNIIDFRGRKSSKLEYKNIDDIGNYISRSLDVSGLTYSKKMDYPLKINKIILYPGGKNFYNKRITQGANKKDWTWRWTKEKMLNAFKKNLLFIKNNRLYQKLYFDYELNKNTMELIPKNRRNKFSSLELLKPNYSNSVGTKLFKKLDLKNFDHPKPISSIKYLINLINNKNSIILDFFAGSGTTGHAVMELNKEDKGNRKFILVTNNEKKIGLEVTYERLYRIIKGETTNNTKEFKWLEKNEPFLNKKLRVFNIKHFDVETNQSVKLNKITKFALNNLKKLNPSYVENNNIDVYYDLDGLNPLNESQKKQKYSTDLLLHEKSNIVKNSNKIFCSCGKSFKTIDDFESHKNIYKIK